MLLADEQRSDFVAGAFVGIGSWMVEWGGAAGIFVVDDVGDVVGDVVEDDVGDGRFCFLAFLFFLFFSFFSFTGLILDGIPDVFSQRGLADNKRFDDYIGFVGVEVGVLEVHGCSLEAVEQKAGGFRIEVFGEDETQDLHDGNLNGVGVLEDGHGKGFDEVRGASFVEIDTGFTPAVVKETVTTVAQCGRSALGAIDLDVLTTSDGTRIQRHDEHSTPHPSVLVESWGWEKIPGKSLRGKGL